MSGGLLHETVAELRKVRGPGAPLFSNMIQAEMWDAECTRGVYRILPRTDGKLAIVLLGAPNGQGTIAVYADKRAALLHLEGLA